MPTVTLTSLPSTSPTIVEKVVKLPGTFSISTDVCSLSSQEQLLSFAAASRKTIQEIACGDLSSCTVDIDSVCGVKYVGKRLMLSFPKARELQSASSWQISYQVAYVFICQTAKCNSPKDEAISSSLVSTISAHITSALASGNFAAVLINNINSGTSNLGFITTACLAVWGIIDTLPINVESNHTEGTGMYYPDWVYGSGTCLKDGEAPLYMQKNPFIWMYDNLEDCCDRYFGGWNKNKCLNQQGSGMWYVDYALSKLSRSSATATVGLASGIVVTMLAAMSVFVTAMLSVGMQPVVELL
eukprot:CCRYP_007291-RA/>CCRYP_007291-RA protein AED:0.19 eAED:0.31 QI:0/0/0/1/1/1/2/0/299